MQTQFYALLTSLGEAKLANATALGEQIAISTMAVGDGNGSAVQPNPAQRALVHEVYRAPLNNLSIDPNNANQLIAELVIPENIGGWWLREIGLFDDQGVLIAVANCGETYKPQLQEGSARVQSVRMILAISNSEAVTLLIDPSVVLATRQFVDLAIHTHAQSRNHPDGTLNAKGFVQLSSAVDSNSETLAATPKAVKTVADSTLKLAKNLADLPDKAAAVENLGISANLLPVGAPIPWPQATPPAGWFKCNGASFDKVKYPLLAAAYPSGKLPDLRGEFIRGWDDARGVDKDRSLLSLQQPTQIRMATADAGGGDSHDQSVPVGIWSSDADSRTLITPAGAADSFGSLVAKLEPYRLDNAVMGTSHCYFYKNSVSWISTRPRNIAFSYIVRAA
ncbi:phage tail protein [Serratia microhaemolytica]|uniref:phage tail-collar fiber domain-containing protein n=1 Tax=Serratia microhaemolytica TaxID=2675110 RepID=UPI000FDEE37C|nr:phage tail protein [Serratia microhaemolytica]